MYGDGVMLILLHVHSGSLALILGQECQAETLGWGPLKSCYLATDSLVKWPLAANNIATAVLGNSTTLNPSSLVTGHNNPCYYMAFETQLGKSTSQT